MNLCSLERFLTEKKTLTDWLVRSSQAKYKEKIGHFEQTPRIWARSIYFLENGQPLESPESEDSGIHEYCKER